ncbi:hypothetical protein PF334_002153 [Salmonella enterica]|nr:hypothetical protein [Salmonella enterica]EIU1718654.1 hypothetical protein [Salmonella enterica]EKD9220608.1 hypothetical protein [Salmonella enterica]EKI6025210.1 hypothetical protein [Salmonella enterica]ELS1741161.1 hypothetical protein [Salmonella enterica]
MNKQIAVSSSLQSLRGHLCGQTPVDNVLNDFESVNFVQSEKLRCMSRHYPPGIFDSQMKMIHLVLSPKSLAKICREQFLNAL